MLVAQSAGRTRPPRPAPAAVPVWVAKPYLFDDFGLTGTVEGVDYGFKPATQLTIAAPGHPMAAGRTGTIAFQTGHSVSWGKPTAAATIIARPANRRSQIFAVEPGDLSSAGAAAPACRLTFPLYTTGPPPSPPTALAMFDAAADWAAGNCTDRTTASAPAGQHRARDLGLGRRTQPRRDHPARSGRRADLQPACARRVHRR